MNFLAFIWWSSGILAISALFVFCVLVLRRFLAERRGAYENSVRQSVQNLLFQYMDSETSENDENTAKLLRLNKLERRLLRQVSVSLCNLIQGHERQQIATLLNQIGFRDSCIDAIDDNDIQERLTAITALRLFPSQESQTALTQLMDNKDDSIRIAAIDSLNEIGLLPAPKTLITKLSSDSILQSRDLRTLLRHIARQAPDYLSLLAQSPDISRLLKLAIADAMSESADFSVLRDLFHYADDQDLDIRTTAIRSLGALQHPSAETHIAKALLDAHWQVRASAAQACGLIGLKATIPTLSLMLDENSWWVRFRSAEALAALGTQGLEALKTRASNMTTVDSAGARIAALLLEEQEVDALNELPVGVAHA